MYILGINLSHDRSACLLKDGKILVAVAEERLDGVKKSRLSSPVRKNGISGRMPPLRAINYCLSTEGIGIDEVDLVVADHATEPVNIESLKTVLPIKDKSKIHAIPHPSHHLAHAYSTYFCSLFDESAVLILDTYGSSTGNGTEAESGFYAFGNNLTPVFKNFQKLWTEKESEFKTYYSLTYIYNFISLALGFGIGERRITSGDIISEAGKTMGLASYGGSLKDPIGYVDCGNKRLETEKFTQWALDNNIAKVSDGKLVPRVKPKSVKLTKFHRDLAYTAQAEFEKGVLFLAHRLHDTTKSKNLCIAGGGGLNSIVNKKILDETPFDNVFIQPAATDDGNAIGCALYGWHKIANQQSRFPLPHVYLGRSYTGEIPGSLRKYKLPINAVAETELIHRTAQYLAEGKIVGWFQGGSEFGPRALGHRSILADPRRPDMKDLINEKVKFRESFRPYAPAVLLEFCTDYFDLPCPSQYMLLVATVKQGKRSEIPAVVHVDGTARVQTVTAEDNGVFYELIREFNHLTGVPVLLNTSFNIRGMPIIETPEDALNMFFNSLIDVLVLENFIIAKDESDTMFALADYFFTNDQPDKGFEVAQGALERFPNDARFNAPIARYYYQKEEFLEAVLASERVLGCSQEEGDFNLHRIRGLSYARLGEFAKAIPELHQAELSEPNDEIINFNLAHCYKELNAIGLMDKELEKGTSKLKSHLKGF